MYGPESKEQGSRMIHSRLDVKGAPAPGFCASPLPSRLPSHALASGERFAARSKAVRTKYGLADDEDWPDGKGPPGSSSRKGGTGCCSRG